jgi:hypothetical protein
MQPSPDGQHILVSRREEAHLALRCYAVTGEQVAVTQVVADIVVWWDAESVLLAGQELCRWRWSDSTREVLGTFDLGWIQQVALSSDRSFLALRFNDDEFCLQPLAPGAEPILWSTPACPPEQSGLPPADWLAFAPDGQSVACFVRGGQLWYGKLADERLSAFVPPAASCEWAAVAACFRPDGRLWFAVARQAWGDDCLGVVLDVWDAQTWRCVWSSPALPGETETIALSPDGRRLAVSMLAGRSALLWTLPE